MELTARQQKIEMQKFEVTGPQDFKNIFSAGSSTYTETSGGYETKWLTPVLIGTQTYATGGSLAGLMGFTSSSVGGLPSPLGSDGFGIFLKRENKILANYYAYLFLLYPACCFVKI